jgi:4-amino-4-deoxy-L-arabinose transferase-like glycosyltransferase
MAHANPTQAAAAAPPQSPGVSLFDRLTEGQLGWLVLAMGALLYIPLAGSYGLWDPWETHYGEVGRQMSVRGDYVGLFWPGSPIDAEYFWSKPVFTFWIISFALDLVGLGAGAAPGAIATSTTAEWALRVPFCLLALCALYAVYIVAARFVSRRAGVLAAVALATMPMFSLISRQAMTDMPFVGPMSLALAFVVLALFEPDLSELPRRVWRPTARVSLSWPHHRLFYAGVALTALLVVPQLIAAARDLKLRFHLIGLRVSLPGVAGTLLYVAGLLALLYFAASLRRKGPLYLILAGPLAGVAVLSKGIAGLGFPAIILLVYLVFTWNWRRLARPELLSGLLIALIGFALVAVPWHHAMLIRYGKGFWNELYGDNHWKRFVAGRHGDRDGTFIYFIRELGYAAMPWIALVPAAFARVVLRPFDDRRSASEPRRDVYWLGAIWFVTGYAIVSVSMTKFHHYLLPALPGLALVIGCFLDDLLGTASSRGAASARLTALAGLPLLGLVTFDLTRSDSAAQRLIWLFCYDYVNDPRGRPWPPALQFGVPLLIFAGLFALCTLLLGNRRTIKAAAAGLCVSAMAFTFFLLDVYMKKVSDAWSQKGLIATYYQTRRSPEERLVAWQMYWRGETFYTQNEIFEGPRDGRTVFLGNRNAEDLQDYLRRNPGKRVFFLVERIRFERLRPLLPAAAQPTLTIANDTNNKFVLAVAQL